MMQVSLADEIQGMLLRLDRFWMFNVIALEPLQKLSVIMHVKVVGLYCPPAYLMILSAFETMTKLVFPLTGLALKSMLT